MSSDTESFIADSQPNGSSIVIDGDWICAEAE